MVAKGLIRFLWTEQSRKNLYFSIELEEIFSRLGSRYVYIHSFRFLGDTANKIGTPSLLE